MKKLAAAAHREFAARALAGSESLPPLERAALYEVASEVLRRSDRAAAEFAMTAAKALRLAEEQQLQLFTALNQ